MEQAKVLLNPSTPTKENQETGVCGPGKHRVISINPKLLTPISASKICPQSSKVPSNSKKLIPGSATKLHESTNELIKHPVLSPTLMSLDSVSDSEMTDNTDIGSISELSNLSYEVTSTVKSNHAILPQPLDPVPQNKEEIGNFSKNQPKTFVSPRRERTIEISPSLLLPVTAMPSDNHPFSVTNVGSSANLQPKHYIQSNSRNTVSQSSSLSDLRGSRISINEDIDGMSTFSEAQDSILTSCTEGMTNDYEKLKESLRLADADIAILVSSKQQLQLDLHKETERAKVLAHDMAELEERHQGAVAKVGELQSTVRQKEEIFQSEMENMQGHLQHSTKEMELLRKSLETSQASEASQKSEIDLLQHLSAEQQLKLQRLEKECGDASNKNRELERLLREATAKDEGIESFVKHLTEVKNDVSTRLQDKVMECEKLQIENKMLAAKCADVEHTNEHLVEKSGKHEKLFRETDAENIRLRSKLSVETREKVELNSAVSKLRADLGKVENSFQKLKKQFLDKAAAAQREGTKRAELEDQVKALNTENSKLMNVNAEMRIRDKNVQIEQLLTQSRMSSQERTKLEKNVKELQEHIEANEKSWVSAIQREKTLQESVMEKDDIVSLKVKKIGELESVIKDDNNEILKLKNLLEKYEKSVSSLEQTLREKEQNLIDVTQKERSKISELQSEIEVKNKEAHEADIEHQNRVDGLLQNSKELSEEIDRLQKSLVKKQEETQSADLLGKANDKSHEEGNIQQLELLSELQSARRELSHQIETLQSDKNELQLSLKTAEHKIDQLEQLFHVETQSHERAVAQVQESKRNMEDAHRDTIETLYEKLKQSDEVKKLLGHEMKDLKEQNETMLTKISTLESALEDSRKQLTSNEQHSEATKSQLKNSKEELDFVKQELANVMIQLSDAINRDDKTNGKYIEENGKLQKECETLRSAVVRQQEYCTSLQKHYQDWAKEAQEKMRLEIDEAQRKAEEQQTKLSEMILHGDLDGVGTFDSFAQTDGIQEKEMGDKMSQTEQVNVDFQSDEYSQESNHEISLLVEEKIQLLQENTQQAEMIAMLEGRIGSGTSFGDFASQTTREQLPTSDFSKDDSLLGDMSTQTSYSEHAEQNGEEQNKQMAEMRELQNRIAVVTRENEKLQATIAQLESNLFDLKSSHSCMLEDSGTQTFHEDLPILSVNEGRNGTPSEDASTQTFHDNITVMGAPQNCESLKEELSRSRLEVDDLTAELEKVNAANDSLTSCINDLRASTSKPLLNVPLESKHVDTSKSSSSLTNCNGGSNSVGNRNSIENNCALTRLPDNKSSSNTAVETLPNSPLPSPMTILQTMESKKLKAYKKTVAVLKKQLNDANKNIKNLQTELKVLLEYRSMHSNNNSVDKLSTESETNNENELYDVKKRSALQLEGVKRKALKDKKIMESKVAKMSERLDGLTEANKELRLSVESLQVKLTEKSKQSDIAVKEKSRYQMRARRLQASLRSLAWINGKQDKSLFLSDDYALDDSLPESIGIDSSLDIQEIPTETGSDIRSPGLDSSKNSLPESVVEIEASLKDLQSEIIALERQMQEHNTAVKKSKNQWTRIRQESQDDTSQLPRADQKQSNKFFDGAVQVI